MNKLLTLKSEILAEFEKEYFIYIANNDGLPSKIFGNEHAKKFLEAAIDRTAAETAKTGEIEEVKPNHFYLPSPQDEKNQFSTPPSKLKRSQLRNLWKIKMRIKMNGNQYFVSEQEFEMIVEFCKNIDGTLIVSNAIFPRKDIKSLEIIVEQN